MPVIENVSLQDIHLGWHIDARVLIRILDPDFEVTKTAKSFDRVYVFRFLDVDDPGEIHSPDAWHGEQIYNILKRCLDEDENVVVHCTAGICRSGAVTEMGVMMGFKDTGGYRQPNVLLKKHLINAAGWGYGTLPV